MPKDVFISYSTNDRPIADKLCMVLEELGLDCWIAPRDISPGAEFDVAIMDGIDQCQAIVVVLTPDANISRYVKNEVNRAFSSGKAILTFRVEDIKPAKALEFYLARHQWTDGFPPPLEERISRMARALLELLGRDSREPANEAENGQRVDRTDAVGHRAVCDGIDNGAAPIAKGSEELAVRYKFRIRGDENTNVRDVWLTKTLTWDDLFSRLGPCMLGDGTSTKSFKNALNDYIRHLEDDEETCVDEDTFNSIIVQFRALGFILTSRKGWALSDAGEKYLLQLRPIRKTSDGR